MTASNPLKGGTVSQNMRVNNSRGSLLIGGSLVSRVISPAVDDVSRCATEHVYNQEVAHIMQVLTRKTLSELLSVMGYELHKFINPNLLAFALLLVETCSCVSSKDAATRLSRRGSLACAYSAQITTYGSMSDV